ncbi:MAG: alkaline phosphatase family protein, partial [Phycisphaerae bacterium]
MSIRGMTGARVLIIGLDGATWRVLDPLMAAGRMPRLKAAVDGGSSGVLHSTTPPITPAAWTTFLTGLAPSDHGILDFERYDVRTNRLSLNSTRCLDRVRNIWHILGDSGRRVGSINVPMTYPAVPVNGFMISGFETPGPESRDFVHPRELRDDILRRWPDPTLRTNWRRKAWGGDRLFRANVDYMARSFAQGADMVRVCGDRYGWDVLMVVLKLVDNLQHKTWRYIDPRWCDASPRRRDIVRGCFESLDRAVGVLLDYAAKHDAAVLIVSDHGHGSLEGKVQPNRMLVDWGYLALHGGGARGATRMRHMWDRFRGRTGTFVRSGDVLRDLAVDFSRTRACVMHAGMAGFLYVNLEGRQPTGIVPVRDYEALRDELTARFLSDEACNVVTPQGETVSVFKAVHKPETLYGCSRDGRAWMPDLILTPHDGLAVVRKIRGGRPVQWLPRRRIEGTHRPEGIFVAVGAVQWLDMARIVR